MLTYKVGDLIKCIALGFSCCYIHNSNGVSREIIKIDFNELCVVLFQIDRNTCVCLYIKQNQMFLNDLPSLFEKIKC